MRSCFNPCAREGRDALEAPQDAEPSGGFNPRAREGRDRQVVRCMCKSYRFNPRAREGRDLV